MVYGEMSLLLSTPIYLLFPGYHLDLVFRERNFEISVNIFIWNNHAYLHLIFFSYIFEFAEVSVRRNTSKQMPYIHTGFRIWLYTSTLFVWTVKNYAHHPIHFGEFKIKFFSFFFMCSYHCNFRFTFMTRYLIVDRQQDITSLILLWIFSTFSYLKIATF